MPGDCLRQRKPSAECYVRLNKRNIGDEEKTDIIQNDVSFFQYLLFDS